MVNLHKLNKLGYLTGGSLVASLLAVVSTPQQAEAAILFNIFESGSDVVISTDGGTLDLTGLSPINTATWSSAVYFGGSNNIGAGISAAISGDRELFGGSFTVSRNDGWTDSSSVSSFSSTTGSGIVASFGENNISLDIAGISGSTYTNDGFSMTIAGTSLASLGLVADSSIVTSWGAGADQQFTMFVSEPTPQTTPEPSAILGLLAVSSIGALVGRKKG